MIHDISPNAGLVSGGTTVTITGEHLDLPPGFACILPCPTKVSFNGVEVTPTEISQTRLVVVTPPSPGNARGPVVVMVKTGDGRVAVRERGFTYAAGQQDMYELRLLPIYLDGRIPGSAGSEWDTDFWIYNQSDENAQLAQWPCPINSACPAVFPNTKILVPGESHHDIPPFFRPPSSNPSRLLWVTRNAADGVATNLRVFDVSRSAMNAGTELPVIREHELRTDAINLLNLPMDGRFRHTLRIYDTVGNRSTFRVRLYNQEQAPGPNAAPYHELTITASTEETGEFRTQALFAQIPDLSTLFAREATPRIVRVEIVPETAGSRFWAFVSITNNDTQHVTVITPQ